MMSVHSLYWHTHTEATLTDIIAFFITVMCKMYNLSNVLIAVIEIPTTDDIDNTFVP